MFEFDYPLEQRMYIKMFPIRNDGNLFKDKS